MSRLEAVLFLAREPLSSRRLAKLANLPDGTRARSLARKLRKFYDLRGCAFQIEEVAGGFQLLTRRKFAAWLRRLGNVPDELRLSGPAIETLSVVAYRQPVLRADIEAVRGVQSGEILRQLMERGLVRIVGRADELGRPFLYGTTRQFLQVFGLRNLDELPRAEELRALESRPSTEVASEADEGNHIESDKSFDEDLEEDGEVKTVAVSAEEQSPHNASESRAVEPSDLQAEDSELEDDDLEEEELDDDEFEDDDEEYDDEDEEDDEFEDDEEEFEDDDELEGDWEEVDDDEEDDLEEEVDGEDDEEDEDW